MKLYAFEGQGGNGGYLLHSCERCTKEISSPKETMNSKKSFEAFFSHLVTIYFIIHMLKVNDYSLINCPVSSL